MDSEVGGSELFALLNIMVFYLQAVISFYIYQI